MIASLKLHQIRHFSIKFEELCNVSCLSDIFIQFDVFVNLRLLELQEKTALYTITWYRHAEKIFKRRVASAVAPNNKSVEANVTKRYVHSKSLHPPYLRRLSNETR